jgi:hypothetical protein
MQTNNNHFTTRLKPNDYTMKEKTPTIVRLSGLFVRLKGLEPPRLSAPDPKSGAATNYATTASV